jgi:hypothetical protein
MSSLPRVSNTKQYTALCSSPVLCTILRSSVPRTLPESSHISNISAAGSASVGLLCCWRVLVILLAAALLLLPAAFAEAAPLGNKQKPNLAKVRTHVSSETGAAKDHSERHCRRSRSSRVLFTATTTVSAADVATRSERETIGM